MKMNFLQKIGSFSTSLPQKLKTLTVKRKENKRTRSSEESRGRKKKFGAGVLMEGFKGCIYSGNLGLGLLSFGFGHGAFGCLGLVGLLTWPKSN